jgi:hypothetical protein
MTSGIDKSDREIINKYHNLSKTEDSFRITKSDLEGRPVYARAGTHQRALSHLFHRADDDPPDSIQGVETPRKKRLE